MAASVAGSMLKSNFAARRMARSIRTGSSVYLASGSPMIRSRRAFMSARPSQKS